MMQIKLGKSSQNNNGLDIRRGTKLDVCKIVCRYEKQRHRNFIVPFAKNNQYIGEFILPFYYWNLKILPNFVADFCY